MELAISAWIVWIVLAILLLIIEILSGVVAALCMSVGCLAAVVAAACGASVILQAIVAVATAILAFIFFAPIVRKFYSLRGHKASESLTNMDAIIGREGRVTKTVTASPEDKGRVQVDGDNWLAFTSAEYAPLEHGTKVIVESYDSIVIKVRPAEIR